MTLFPAAEFVAPQVSWQLLMPIAMVMAAGVLGVLIEAFAPVGIRRSLGILLAAIAPLTALAAVVILWPVAAGLEQSATNGELVFDRQALFVQGMLLFVGFLSVLIVADRTALKDGAFAGQPSDRPGSHEETLSDNAGYQRSEMFSLMMLSLTGMMVFPVAHSFVALFVALEVMSLPLYILAATARRRRQLSQEAGMKYFILGAFASAFFLMGFALIYGATGSLYMSRIGQILQQMLASGDPSVTAIAYLLQAGIVLVMIGLLFKVGAAPFHAWTPDVYTGAPTPITGFMAAAVKIAAFGAMARFYQLLGAAVHENMLPVYVTIIVATIAVGTFGGLVQFDIKRMLAFSSIAHAGYILLGIMAVTLVSIYNVYFYLLAYSFATIGAFAIVSLVRSVDKDGNIGGEVTDLRRWAGLGRTNPVVAGAFTLFLLSFAGIPLTGGFVGKFLLFKDAMGAGLVWLVVVALLSSAITAFFYFRVIRVLFFEQPTGDTVVVSSEGLSSVAILLSVVGTIALGIFPTVVLGLLY